MIKLDNIPCSEDCGLEDTRNKITHMKFSESALEHRKMLVEAITVICEVINQRKKSHNTDLKNEVMKFIEENHIYTILN